MNLKQAVIKAWQDGMEWDWGDGDIAWDVSNEELFVVLQRMEREKDSGDIVGFFDGKGLRYIEDCIPALWDVHMIGRMIEDVDKTNFSMVDIDSVSFKDYHKYLVATYFKAVHNIDLEA